MSLKTDIEDAIQALVDGKPGMSSFQVGDQKYQARSIKELSDLLDLATKIEAQADTDPNNFVTYGSYGGN